MKTPKKLRLLILYSFFSLFIYGIIVMVTYLCGANFPEEYDIILSRSCLIKFPYEINVSGIWNFLAGILFVWPIVLVATSKKARENETTIISSTILILAGLVVGIICGFFSVQHLAEGMGIFFTLILCLAFSFMSGLTQGSLGYLLPLSAGLFLTLFLGFAYSLFFVIASLLAVFVGTIFYLSIIKQVVR